jgi:hypothetical protein
MPRVLVDAIARCGDPVDLASTNPAALALQAVGGCVKYLTRCLIDRALLSLALVSTYHPAEITSGSSSTGAASGGRAEWGGWVLVPVPPFVPAPPPPHACATPPISVQLCLWSALLYVRAIVV